MKSAIVFLSVLALTGYAACAANVPYHEVYYPRYEPRQEYNRIYKMDYPASTANPAAIQVFPDKQISLKPGMTSGGVIVIYSSPNKGRVTVNLLNANGDILIHIDARFDWYTWKNILVLNSKKVDGNWGVRVQPDGFPFPCNGYTTTIVLQVEIGETAFVISANGKEIATYPYREDLAPPVDAATYYFGDTGASEKAELKSLSVY